MVKKLIILLLLVAPLTAIAQEKIAVVNFQELMVNMPDIKDIETKMAAKQETVKKTLETIQGEYKAKYEDYNKQLEKYNEKDPTVTESVLLDQQKSIAQLEERYQNFAQTSQAEIEKLQMDLLRPVHEKIQKAIKELGDEQGYQYILDSSVLLYTGSSAIDATKLAKTRLGIAQ